MTVQIVSSGAIVQLCRLTACMSPLAVPFSKAAWRSLSTAGSGSVISGLSSVRSGAATSGLSILDQNQKQSILHWQGDLLGRFSGHVVEMADSLFLKEMTAQDLTGPSLKLEERFLRLRREEPFSSIHFSPQHSSFQKTKESLILIV
jgi:hypothetical protein